MIPAGLPEGLLRFEQRRHKSPLGRWTFTAAHPCGPLADWVELLWYAETDFFASRERILPRGRLEVLFNLGPGPHLLIEDDGAGEARGFSRSWVSGLQQTPLLVESPSRVKMAGIRLRVPGALPFLGLPPSEVVHRVIHLDEVLGRGVEELRCRMAGAGGAEALLTLLAEAVVARAAGGPACSPEVRFALSRLAATGGNHRIRELVREIGWSHRRFTDRFQEQVGLGPKAYARILRFQEALRRLDGAREVRWAELALECGYYDQAHLARDFREMAGATPTEVHRSLIPGELSLTAS